MLINFGEASYCRGHTAGTKFRPLNRGSIESRGVPGVRIGLIAGVQKSVAKRSGNFGFGPFFFFVRWGKWLRNCMFFPPTSGFSLIIIPVLFPTTSRKKEKKKIEQPFSSPPESEPYPFSVLSQKYSGQAIFCQKKRKRSCIENSLKFKKKNFACKL